MSACPTADGRLDQAEAIAAPDLVAEARARYVSRPVQCHKRASSSPAEGRGTSTLGGARRSPTMDISLGRSGTGTTSHRRPTHYGRSLIPSPRVDGSPGGPTRSSDNRQASGGSVFAGSGRSSTRADAVSTSRAGCAEWSTQQAANDVGGLAVAGFEEVGVDVQRRRGVGVPESSAHSADRDAGGE